SVPSPYRRPACVPATPPRPTARIVIVFSPPCSPRTRRSFPPRRTSDLDPPRHRALLRRCLGRGRARRQPGCSQGGHVGLGKIPRSEEPTSELQSREKLACRVLLERKQPATTRRPTTSARSRPTYGATAC